MSMYLNNSTNNNNILNSSRLKSLSSYNENSNSSILKHHSKKKIPLKNISNTPKTSIKGGNLTEKTTDRVALGDISNYKKQHDYKKSTNNKSIISEKKTSFSKTTKKQPLIYSEKKLNIALKKPQEHKNKICGTDIFVDDSIRKSTSIKEKKQPLLEKESIIFEDTLNEKDSLAARIAEVSDDGSFYDEIERPAGRMWHEQSDDEVSELSWVQECIQDIREAKYLEVFGKYKKEDIPVDAFESQIQLDEISSSSDEGQGYNEPDPFDFIGDLNEHISPPDCSWRDEPFPLSDTESDFEF